MKISIVTISYNQAEFLERAIKSVLEQDYGDIEYIIVDPGSTDGSREIIERYRDKIAKVIFEPDKGPADGLNKGFTYATGDIFGYINSDDAYLPGAVREVVEVFQNYPSPDVVYGWGYIIDQHNKIIKEFRSTPFTLWRFAYGGVWIMQQSTFFKKQAFFDVGGFNVENQTCWDGELLVDFGLSGKKFKLIRRYWSVFTIHDSSISGSQRLQREYLCDCNRMFKKIIGRKPKRIDVIFMLIARLQKWLFDPLAFILRMKERMICCFYKRPYI